MRMSSTYPLSPSANSVASYLTPRLADAAWQVRGGDRAVLQQLDRLEDLRVAGAAAEVGPEPAGGGLEGEVAPFLIEQRLGAHQDAWCAEAALERPGHGERIGQLVALGFVEAFKGRDRFAAGLLHADQAGLDRLPVEEHRAGTALAGGSTSILGRG